jgi:ABC-type transport system involved in multi-copper enzyme maturation permease subunit
VVKLSRPATLFGFGGTMIAFTLLFTIMAFESAGGRNIDLDVTTAMLSLPEGSILVVTDMAVFLGIVALALFASNLAGEFSKGTIRMLFWNKATPGPRWSPRWREAARIVRSFPAPVFPRR